MTPLPPQEERYESYQAPLQYGPITVDEDGFQRHGIAYIEIYVCKDCGALVLQRQVHDTFHRRTSVIDAHLPW